MIAGAVRPARCTRDNAARAARAWSCPGYPPTIRHKRWHRGWRGLARSGQQKSTVPPAGGCWRSTLRTRAKSRPPASVRARAQFGPGCGAGGMSSGQPRFVRSFLSNLHRNLHGLTISNGNEGRASMRQIREPEGSAGWRWGGMKRFLGKPPIELFATAIAGGRWYLIMALSLAARAGDPNMKMVIVTPPRPNFCEPPPV